MTTEQSKTEENFNFFTISIHKNKTVYLLNTSNKNDTNNIRNIDTHNINNVYLILYFITSHLFTCVSLYFAPLLTIIIGISMNKNMFAAHVYSGI